MPVVVARARSRPGDRIARGAGGPARARPLRAGRGVLRRPRRSRPARRRGDPPRAPTSTPTLLDDGSGEDAVAGPALRAGERVAQVVARRLARDVVARQRASTCSSPARRRRDGAGGATTLALEDVEVLARPRRPAGGRRRRHRAAPRRPRPARQRPPGGLPRRRPELRPRAARAGPRGGRSAARRTGSAGRRAALSIHHLSSRAAAPIKRTSSATDFRDSHEFPYRSSPPLGLRRPGRRPRDRRRRHQDLDPEGLLGHADEAQDRRPPDRQGLRLPQGQEPQHGGLQGRRSARGLRQGGVGHVDAPRRQGAGQAR